MTNTTQSRTEVTQMQMESAHGVLTLEVTMHRSPDAQPLPPSTAADVPPDVRQALLKWLNSE